MHKDRKYFHLIPEKVLNELEEIEWDYGFGLIPGYRRYWFEEVITVIAMRNRKEGDGGAVNMELLKKMVPQGQAYIKKLLEAGIVVRDGFYVKGSTSFKYHFADDWKSPYKYYPVTEPRLLRRLGKVSTTPRKGRPKFKEEQSYFLKPEITKIDIDAAVAWIDKSILRDESGQVHPEVMNVYNNWVGSVFRFDRHISDYTIDKTGQRFHSVLTSLPKHLRQFVTIYGKPIISLDLKNSQPLLSTILLIDPAKAIPFTDNDELSMILKSLVPSEAEDVKEFTFLCFYGRIYEALIEEAAKFGKIITRDQAKDLMFKILFAQGGHYPKERAIFSNRFPTVSAIFDKVRGNNPVWDRFNDYRRFPILLQRVESYIILERVLIRLRREHKDIPGLSNHDSLYTLLEEMSESGSVLTYYDPITEIETQHNIKVIKQIMEEEIALFYGGRQPLPATIQVEVSPTELPKGFWDLKLENIRREALQRQRRRKRERRGGERGELHPDRNLASY